MQRVQVGAAARAALLGLAWLAGSALQLRQPSLWPPAVVLGLAAAAALMIATAWRWKGGRVGIAVCCLAVSVMAFAATAWRAERRLADALPAALEGQDLLLTGTIAQLPRSGLTGTRFVFAVDDARAAGSPVTVPQRVSLAWSRGFDDDTLVGGPQQELRAGQRWRLPVRLQQPHGALNPHGFDLEAWLFEQGLRATGSVRATAAAPARLLDPAAGHVIARMRQRVRDAIEARVPDARAAGVLAALAVGDQAAIDRADWDVFRLTGVAHLMSISGLHVTMFAWLAGALCGRLWRLSARALLWLPTPTAARWGGLVAAAAYAALAGFGVPAQRTVWMIGVVVLLRTLGLRWPLPAVLLAAAVLVGALDPWALAQPGFWLSFGAVALLAASEGHAAGAPPAAPGRWQRVLAVVRGGLRTQAVASIGLAPLSLLFFHQVSLVGFAANLVAIPLVTLLVTPLALLGVLLPPLWWLAAMLVNRLTALLQHAAAWPLAVWTAPAAPAWAVAAGLCGGLLVLLPLPWRLRACGLPLLLPLLLPAVARPPDGRFELVAADVGQGNAVLVRTRHYLLVYDTGPPFGPEADAGSRVLVPLLQARGERSIDLLVLSHRDADHVGGARSVLGALPVAALRSSLEAAHPLLAGNRGATHRPCADGESWSWDGVRFEFLHPLAGATAAKPNALSCVLRIQAGDGSAVLLAGDIEAAQEAALVARAGSALRADVLLVPHHGSRTSSSAAFIDAVQPRWALVQAAYRSRFGHPAPDVEARYAARGARVVRSDRCGAFTLQADGGTRCEREAARRYWHDRPPPAAVPPAVTTGGP